MNEKKSRELCETCPIEDAYAAMPLEDRLYLNWQSVAHSVRQRVGGGGAERKLLRLLERCGAMERRELLAAAGAGSSGEEALERLAEKGLVTDRERPALTETGAEAAKRTAELQSRERRALFADLNREEKEQLLSLLEKLNIGELGQ